MAGIEEVNFRVRDLEPDMLVSLSSQMIPQGYQPGVAYHTDHVLGMVFLLYHSRGRYHSRRDDEIEKRRRALRIARRISFGKIS